MMGGIVLRLPPGFLVCTHPRATQIAMLDFYEDYLEGKIIADVPPSVRTPQHIAEKTLLLQLLVRREEETSFDPTSRELVKGRSARVTIRILDASPSSCLTRRLQRAGIQNAFCFVALVFSYCVQQPWREMTSRPHRHPVLLRLVTFCSIKRELWFMEWLRALSKLFSRQVCHAR